MSRSGGTSSASVVRRLTARHGARSRADVERGVAAAARVWPSERDDFPAFCLAHYVPPGPARRALLARLDAFHRGVAGGIGATLKVTRAGVEVDQGRLGAPELLLAAFDPTLHLAQDYRRAGVAALIQLNFGDPPHNPRGRAGWAAWRLAEVGRLAPTADQQAALAAAIGAAEAAQAEYILHLDRIRFADPAVRFEAGARVDVHWGVRERLSSTDDSREGLACKRALCRLLADVVRGAVPHPFPGNRAVRWDREAGRVRHGGRWGPAGREGARRWTGLHAIWQARRAQGPAASALARAHDPLRDLSPERTERLLVRLVDVRLAARVGRCLAVRLGRPLEAFDLYQRPAQSPLDEARAAARFPDADALGRAIPAVLRRMGWPAPRARWIAERIRVEPGRGPGHAWRPLTSADVCLVRVPIPEGGCDRGALETFMHELGHAVEGVVSAYEMDFALLWGVPAAAFSEALAFLFEERTDALLPARRRRVDGEWAAIQRFWEAYELAGAALVELRLHRRLATLAEAAPETIQSLALQIAADVWRRHYAPVLGPGGMELLASYSHLLTGDLYLSAYPLGHLIAQQLRRRWGDGTIAAGVEQAFGQGRLHPDRWMRGAVGAPVSAGGLLARTRGALRALETPSPCG